MQQNVMQYFQRFGKTALELHIAMKALTGSGLLCLNVNFI